ncbi:ubiquitin-like domain-containing protein [Paraflavitalea sp. CAU 1676]|uniref:ubiquitin-like domain-containing protein n=1 Tax=Paraflavitalea sp. CAU 1676 TaxID=3032598 RepID=UPI0023DB5294|nr:ubiquitin-like domain-containing protein [Paraflavitalea sp. CAU 1676]MDF2189076.1 ubiquitin family protein [Paraflavitalea sp. CAU 1676]
MKKLLPLIAACLLMTAGFATPSTMIQPASLQPVLTGEPEPHPNNLYVKLKVNGQTTILWLLSFPDDTIGDVKSSVEDIVGFPINYLSYKGQVLDESGTLASYGIGANATLNAY